MRVEEERNISKKMSKNRQKKRKQTYRIVPSLYTVLWKRPYLGWCQVNTAAVWCQQARQRHNSYYNWAMSWARPCWDPKSQWDRHVGSRPLSMHPNTGWQEEVGNNTVTMLANVTGRSLEPNYKHYISSWSSSLTLASYRSENVSETVISLFQNCAAKNTSQPHWGRYDQLHHFSFLCTLF